MQTIRFVLQSLSLVALTCHAMETMIAAEMIATNVGLGYMLFVARDFYRTEVIVFGMIVIGVLWLLIDRLLLVPLERSTIERWGMVRRA